jgi:serine protease DegQ
MATPPRRQALYASRTPRPSVTSTAPDAPRAERASGSTRSGTRSVTAPASVPGADPSFARERPRRARTAMSAALTVRWLLLSLLLAAMAAYLMLPWRQWVPQRLTQEVLDRAVLHTLDKHPTPAPAAKAYAAVMPSVVRVIGVQDDDDGKLPDPKEVRPPKRVMPGPPTLEQDEKAKERSADKDKPKSKDADKPAKPEDKDDDSTVGTGVVIIDNGTILTNMHVVLGAKQVKVEFADGLVSDAEVAGVRPEHDLAVLRAKRIPDDLQAATMRSTSDLKPGDRVTAIGFPFGIGPSVSHGVVSGLKRDFRSPKGDKVLSNLIQFDAAANPGNSGGPLVTDDGAVVGIVTAIYNPGQGRFFVGLGFAVPIENAAQAAGLPPF